MEFLHRPVLLAEVLAGIAPRADGIYVDGTLGGGGHAAEICARLSESGLLIGIDRDADALAAARETLASHPCAKLFVRDDFKNIKRILRENGVEKLDGALLDLGVSSFQLDEAERGFSYMRDAPLDMRMDASRGITAEDVVNDYSRDELTRVIAQYGEERWASRISAFIVKRRGEARIRRTGELSDIVKAAIPASARRDGPHPAKRTFQAIRIEVNGEIDGLGDAMGDFVDCLGPSGRLCVISFHSLEDRAVKELFALRENPCVCPKDLPVCACGRTSDGRRITRKPIRAGADELRDNPRARGAKLRIFEKWAQGKSAPFANVRESREV
ncbi:MAG: 16S rRNA (cytosine(1402)-N(4))-methyltransferase RsmH [Clostridiales Family XIII bacterium]|jgi:16S rRNA (cytosine1402-N4)-methyltransferase|nr:16S rRNA (cytosine(1402)-N(4))-methyltransferase RsmH [Clostridiales Family XIII bacterium]